MGIEEQSPLWRRALFKACSSRYFRRKCRTADGIFEAYVSANSGLSVLDIRKSLVAPTHERFIREWVESDAVVWDIGANLGLFGLPAALKVSKGRVYMFEPDVELAGNLLRSLGLQHNKKLNASVVCLAVSNADGIQTFQISKFSRAMNKLEAVGKFRENQIVVKERRSVATMRIDSLSEFLAPPTVLKIDVEGAEVNVLESGNATISKHRPTILIEGPQELWDPMWAFFERHHYVLLDGSIEDKSPLAQPAWDTVAVPAEKYGLSYARSAVFRAV
jgi:FkbM family methyltransferase